MQNTGRKTILVMGGAGALGTAIVEAASAAGATTITVDMKAGPIADISVVIQPEDIPAELTLPVSRVDAVYCVAGAWSGGSITADDLVTSAEHMWAVNVRPSLMAAQMAAQFHAELLVLTSAKAVTHGTPDMLTYGMAKKAVVHLATSLAADPSVSFRSLCILPYTLPCSLPT